MRNIIVQFVAGAVLYFLVGVVVSLVRELEQCERDAMKAFIRAALTWPWRRGKP